MFKIIIFIILFITIGIIIPTKLLFKQASLKSYKNYKLKYLSLYFFITIIYIILLSLSITIYLYNAEVLDTCGTLCSNYTNSNKKIIIGLMIHLINNLIYYLSFKKIALKFHQEESKFKYIIVLIYILMLGSNFFIGYYCFGNFIGNFIIKNKILNIIRWIIIFIPLVIYPFDILIIDNIKKLLKIKPRKPINYIEQYILPKYKNKDEEHNIKYIKYVINRSIKLANEVDDINYNMIYVIAAYHDIGYSIDKNNSALLSSQMLKEDHNLEKYFTKEEIDIMSSAIKDIESPKDIYSQILQEASLDTNINISLKKIYNYHKNKYPNLQEDELIEKCRTYLKKEINKNKNIKKLFIDKDYTNYLKDMHRLTNNKRLFKEQIINANKTKR